MTSLVTSQPIPGVRPRVVRSAAGQTAAPGTSHTSPPEPANQIKGHFNYWPIRAKVTLSIGQSENSLVSLRNFEENIG